MFGNLKTQLLLSTIASLALLLMGVWASSHGLMGWATAIQIVICAYIIMVNIWFWISVSQPLSRLTEHARRISEGSYGTKIEGFADDEIGELADQMNSMSEKAAVAERGEQRRTHGFTQGCVFDIHIGVR